MVNGFDEEIKTVDLTASEIDLLEMLLVDYFDKCVSVGEEITVQELLDKLR